MTHLDLFFALWLLRQKRVATENLAEQFAACFGSAQHALPRLLIDSKQLNDADCQEQLESLRSYIEQRDWDYPTVLSDVRTELPPECELDFWTLLSRQLEKRAPSDFSRRYENPIPFAKGALGEVLTVVERSTGRQVALKRMKPGVGEIPTMVERFLTEGQITARLEHPNIVPVYEYRDDPDASPYYTMRLLKGRTLSKAIVALHKITDRKEHQRERRRLLVTLIQVSYAIDYAHSLGVVHRDIKPDNILIGQFGEVIVLDWGLACVREPSAQMDDIASLSASETHEGMKVKPIASDEVVTMSLVGDVVGTPAFMAPEQTTGEPSKITPATDIFCLGGLLYYLLCGQPPYRSQPSESTDAMLSRIASGKRPSILSVRPGAPRPLVAICDKAMATKPQDRYATVAAMSADIQRWLINEPVEAYVEPASQRLARWAIRNRVVTLAVGGVMMLATLLIVSLLATRWAERRLVMATQQRFIERRAGQLAYGGENWKQKSLVDMRLYQAILESLGLPLPDKAMSSLTNSDLANVATILDHYAPQSVHRAVNLIAAEDPPIQLFHLERTSFDQPAKVNYERTEADRIQRYFLDAVRRIAPGEVFFAPNDPFDPNRPIFTEQLWSASGVWRSGQLVGCITQRLSLADAFNIQMEREKEIDQGRIRYHLVATETGQTIWSPDSASRELLEPFIKQQDGPFQAFNRDGDLSQQFVAFEHGKQRYYAYMVKEPFSYSDMDATFVYLLATDYTRLSQPTQATIYGTEAALTTLLLVLIAMGLWLSRTIVKHAYRQD